MTEMKKHIYDENNGFCEESILREMICEEDAV